MIDLETSLEHLSGIGPKMLKRFNRLGLFSVLDLLYYFPKRYEDFSRIISIQKAKSLLLEKEQAGSGLVKRELCIKGRILEIKTKRSPQKKMHLTFALISDQTDSIEAVWFNQPFIKGALKKGKEFVFSGKMEYKEGRRFLSNPVFEAEKDGEFLHLGRIAPVYPETEGLSSKYLRRAIKSVLPLAESLSDFLPKEIKEKEGLLDLSRAISQIHFPESRGLLDRARERLAFDEVFLIQLRLLEIKKKWLSQKAPLMHFEQELIRLLVKSLPFKLTNAQRKAAWEIIGDLSGRTKEGGEGSKERYIAPMNRLLEGDVGSGKTVVAAIAMLLVAKNGFQSAFMVPTEILAIQHYQTLTNLLLDFGVNIALFTHGKNELNKQKEKRGVMVDKIKKGEIDIAVGTHALLQSEIRFSKLGLVVVDEQHRFGIRQRAILRKKSEKANLVPHILSMSATPIPRTLSLALYGDLEISILNEMPPGRQKVATFLVPPQKREATYQFIRKQIGLGRQAFVICPLIEESERLEVRAVTEEYQRLSTKVFPDFKLGLLHGKMKTKEKERIMEDFKKHRFDILVSTAVVEVGVDVPNATVMVIEGAERFGLAQLHQFRGRVGRASFKSYCFLFTETSSAGVIKRLKALVYLDDGFKLAEKDLEIRGPGELYGTRQHGFLDLKMASLADAKMLQRAREAAIWVLGCGVENYPALVEKMKKIEQKSRLE